jgi:hypothetical protein
MLREALTIARGYVAAVDGTMTFTTPDKRLTAPDLAVIDAAIAKTES